jgi:flavin reductase (DIM6/NTAB) family NADH-FMN oxidoreductase RutF
MEFDLRAMDARDRYKLLVGVVVPRPIALVTTVDAEGRVNAAPFSFFNAMGSDPPIVVLGIGDRPGGGPKDSARNIRATGEFVVNLVDETLAERMNVCAVDFPAGTDELKCAGLTCLAQSRWRTPRIAESRVGMFCREIQTVEIGRSRVVMGEVLTMYVGDEFVDPERLHVRAEELGLIGRMHGAGWYVRTTDLFQMPRLTVAEWEAKSGGGAGERP